jgi:hypothetical protein
MSQQSRGTLFLVRLPFSRGCISGGRLLVAEVEEYIAAWSSCTLVTASALSVALSMRRTQARREPLLAGRQAGSISLARSRWMA